MSTANINIDSIMSKVKAWAKSEQGRERIKECVGKYVEYDVRNTKAGSKIVTEKMMKEAADKFMEILLDTAAAYDLPASVIQNISDSRRTGPEDCGDGKMAVSFVFGADDESLHRESIVPDEYDGVNNIIAILNNGYEAHDFVYGDWHSLSTGETKHIQSLEKRKGIYFIQEAVRTFNFNYGKQYNVTATYSSEYE